MDMQPWLFNKKHNCSCGREHSASPLCWLEIDANILNKLPYAIKKLDVKKPFVVMGEFAKRVAGETILQVLTDNGIPFTSICLAGAPKVLPNEEYLARIEASYDESCDFVLGVGSGVINDLCKMIAHAHGIYSGIVATAPSMDGYASNSAAMELRGVKTTVYTNCPALILCDTEILRKAPEEMLRAGFGDMAAKIISIADWRIAHLITGEYYCETIAQMMRTSCETVLNHAKGILAREESAIKSMTEGLVLSGIAMTSAGVSRPASGTEHTISHLLEMFALARGAQPALHGLQVGFGVRAALALYKKAHDFCPSKETCVAACEAFDETVWGDSMRHMFGDQANELIQIATNEQRNSQENRMKRGEMAIEHWPEIQEIISEVICQSERLITVLDFMSIPQLWEPGELGYSVQEIENAIIYSKDLRNRYIFTSMCADIGLNYVLKDISTDRPLFNGFSDSSP